jgi:hypothetical protein
MKKLFLFAISSLAANLSFGQFTKTWPTATQSNAVQSGFVGIGTKPTSSSTAMPNFNLHLHGTADFLMPASGGVTGMVTFNDGEVISNSGLEKSSLNVGKTTRLGFTNTTTGLLSTDGAVLRMSENSFFITNQEAGDLTLSVPQVGMRFSNSDKRIFVGGLSSPSSNNFARFNIAPPNTENGLYIHNTGSGTYGISVRTAVNTNDAIRVMGIDGSLDKKNFSVRGNGDVFARKYTTTLGDIPDYVFDPSYKLMSLNELKTFITTNKHLPNIPSAKEYEERGELDLGELNLKLLEKVEELSLYILQLEERMKALENK